MAKGNIILSKEHGVNPSITVCPVCGKETGLALFGKLKDDAKAPKYVTGEPCADCQKKFDEGYIAIIAMESKTQRSNKYAFIPKDAIAIDVKGNIALMDEQEFNVIFKDS